MCASSPVVSHLLAVRGAAAAAPLAHVLGCPGTGRDSIDGLRGCQATMPRRFLGGPLFYARVRTALEVAEGAGIWHKYCQMKSALGRNGSRAPEGLEGASDAANADPDTEIGVSRLDFGCVEPGFSRAG